MSKLNVGDTVIVIQGNPSLIGYVGIVDGFGYSPANIVFVNMGISGYKYFSISDLALVCKQPDGKEQSSKSSGGNSGFLAILDEIRDIHLKKSKDYGTNEDQLINLRASSDLGIDPWVATVIRMGDKFQRIKSLINKGKLENESVEDSFLDIAVYSLLALQLYRENQNRKK